MNSTRLRIIRLVAAWPAALLVLLWVVSARCAEPVEPQPPGHSAFDAPHSERTPSDEVWLVSTRGECDVTPGAVARLPYRQLGADHCWIESDANAFLVGASPDVPQVFYFHGNGTTACDAVEEGWKVYLTLKADARGRPFRFIIWSWPSDRVGCGIRTDLQIKAVRSELESYYLGETLLRIPPNVPISLIGHSFGARTVGGTLELMAGNEFAGRRLSQPSPVRRPLRAALIAAAIDAGTFGSEGVNHSALALTDRVLVTCNNVDCVLRWYPRLWGRCGPEAMGFVGPCGGSPEKLEVLNLSCETGHCHAWARYWNSPSLRARLGWYAFLE